MTTLKFALPLLLSSQAQKDVTVNQALTQLDAIVQLSVISRIVGTPPASPANEEAYIVPAGATGAWTGQTNNIAIYLTSTGGWVFITPRTGWLVWSQADATFYAFNVSWMASAAAALKGSFTLTPNSGTTTVTQTFCTATSVVLVTPSTHDAATSMTGLSIVPGVGQFVCSHGNNANVDRTFNYVLYI